MEKIAREQNESDAVFGRRDPIREPDEKGVPRTLEFSVHGGEKLAKPRGDRCAEVQVREMKDRIAHPS